MTIPGGLIIDAIFRPNRRLEWKEKSADGKDNTKAIKAMCTIEESHYDELAITDHPVEFGASISDHAYMLPYELRIRFAWSKSGNSIDSIIKSGLAALDSAMSGADNYLEAQYRALRTLQQKRLPFDIITGKRLYQDMLIKSLAVETDAKTENALFVEMVCRQVMIVKVAGGALDSGAQKNPAETAGVSDAGAKQAQPAPGAAPN